MTVPLNQQNLSNQCNHLCLCSVIRQIAEVADDFHEAVLEVRVYLLIIEGASHLKGDLKAEVEN